MDFANGGWKSSPFVKFIAGIGTGIDVDGLYGLQCKDFVQAYSIALEVPFTAGNAITLWEIPQQAWTKENSPQIGDVFVRDAVFQGINYGDTGIVTGITSKGINVVQQNLAANLDQGSPPASFFWPFYAIKGYLRKEDNIMTPDQVNAELEKRDKRMDDDEANVGRLYKTVDEANQNLGRLYTTVDEINKAVATLQNAPKPDTITPSDPNSVTVTETGLWTAFKKFLGL